MKRFTIIDRAPHLTTMREHAERGELVCIRGQIAGKVLGSVEARNAADAVAEARRRWPHVRLEQLDAREEHEVDRASPYAKWKP